MDLSFAKISALKTCAIAKLMLLRALKDQELLKLTDALAQKERHVTLEMLRHLHEIERRKLYGDLGFGSLFEYAVKRLKYSEGAASRRIQAMRLLAEFPELESKIASGCLNLTNICQAQSFFRDLKRAQAQMPMKQRQAHAPSANEAAVNQSQTPAPGCVSLGSRAETESTQEFSKAGLSHEEKKEVLACLENKSAREGQKVLLSITEALSDNPVPLLKERERVVSAEHTEVRFLVNSELKEKLEQVRSLLGPKGALMSLAELVAEMASLSAERLEEQRFGKKRVRQLRTQHSTPMEPAVHADPGAGVSAPEIARRSRHIPTAIKHQVWSRAGGKCECCGSRRNLQYDHAQPFALGGDSSSDNLRLLCGSCNLRQGVKTFGASAMQRA